MKEFTIYYNDLSMEAREAIREILDTTPEEENWDIVPLAVIEREEELKEKQEV